MTSAAAGSHPPTQPPGSRHGAGLPRNVWVASATSFLTDISSEMIINVLPLFLANVLGVGTAVIGLIEGVAGATASLLKAPAGWVSDRIGSRKWPAVVGYAVSTGAKPFLLLATSWQTVAGARWADRVGKGVRTAPRDALLADSTGPGQRGLAFGLHRAADTAGAALGIVVAIAVVSAIQGRSPTLGDHTFRILVLASLVPAALAVLVLALGAVDTGARAKPAAAHPPTVPRLRLRNLGSRFMVFLGISAIFDLGNFSDAFIVLRAQDQGLGVTDILWLMVAFNVVYALVATPAGSLSDRWGRKRILVAGWLLYAAVYLGFGTTHEWLPIGALFVLYGIYYGLTMGTAKALISDLAPPALRGSAYGIYHTVLGVIDLPASIIAGVLWQGVGSWHGMGAAAPFIFGAATALLAALLLGVTLQEAR